MAKIRDLKELVPDFELCNKIPLGEFEDSVFGWRYSPQIGLKPDWEVVPRAGNDVDCPAPTLEEIIEKLAPVELRRDKDSGWSVFRRPAPGTDHLQVGSDKSLANVALKIWFASRNEE